MITQQPSFTDHMINLQRAQKESLQEVLQHLHQQKILSNDHMVLNVPEIATKLNQRTIDLTRQINATNDVNQKLNLLSAQITLLSSISLLAITISVDTKIDIKKINDLLYLR